jgi:hypothetical protein
MGFRTVVILANDQAHLWDKDPELGQKIFRAQHASTGWRQHFPYGSIAECCHADTQSLGIIDSYHFKPIAHDMWTRNETPSDIELKMLKLAAEKLGYKLVRKAKKEK